MSDALLANRAALASMYCDQRNLEREVDMIEADMAGISALMKKYGPENFVTGQRRVAEERSRAGSKLGKVCAQIDAANDHVEASLQYSNALSHARQASAPLSVSSSAMPHDQYTPVDSNLYHPDTNRLNTSASHLSDTPAHHRIPTIADSRILSNSSAYRNPG
ncbi:hypothetical protein DIPPA_07553 [Diplonema papillatum]|nr:hypothetical protein DIPPA_07553 [Diplonema papillatum]|eukprot:gene1151-1767_t